MNLPLRSYMGAAIFLGVVGAGVLATNGRVAVAHSSSPPRAAPRAVASLARDVAHESSRLLSARVAGEDAVRDGSLAGRFDGLPSSARGLAREALEIELRAETARAASSQMDRQALLVLLRGVAEGVLEPSSTPEASTIW